MNKTITRIYLNKLREQSLIDLNLTITLQSNKIAKLEEETNRLSRIVHKDNKLIPAMMLAVASYLEANENSNEKMETQGKDLIHQLEKLSEKRNGIVQHESMNYHMIPSTNLSSIDYLLTYMQRKASEKNIIFQTNISCDLQYFTNTIIHESELNTLLADFLENAIIATKHSHGHYILLSISILSQSYTISVFDSGIPFSTEVLYKWGVEQISTHVSEGGSGIGMMEAYDIIKKYHASFIVREFGTNYSTFTKQLTITFNKLNQYILQTQRPPEELALLSQRTDLQIHSL